MSKMNETEPDRNSPDFGHFVTDKDSTPNPDEEYRKVFQSSNLLQGRYNSRTSLLTIEFGLQGARYEFSNVPLDTWFKLTSAISPGEFFHHFIKPNFEARRVA